MDSGAFGQLWKHGKFLISVDQYIEDINRFSKHGSLKAAVAQDWICEPFLIERTGKSVQEHQALTIQSYVELRQRTDVPILPVLQGFGPGDYGAHVRQYGNLLETGQWVGVGSVCNRNGNPDAVEDVLLAIKSQWSDLRLHGFGLKIQAIERPTIRASLHSSDSMAWEISGLRVSKYENAHDPRLALVYSAKIQQPIQKPSFVQEQLFEWWG